MYPPSASSSLLNHTKFFFAFLSLILPLCILFVTSTAEVSHLSPEAFNSESCVEGHLSSAGITAESSFQSTDLSASEEEANSGEKFCPETGLLSISEKGSCAEAMSTEKGWSALVSGGTGAIGRHLVAQLLRNDKFAFVTVIGRREISFPEENRPSPEQVSTKLRYKQVSDLSEIESLEPSQLTPSTYDVAFCALGTTRKDAGSAEAFRKIDYDGVVAFGNLAKRAEARHLQLVTSVGSNKNALFLYLKTKGEAEEFYRSLPVKQTTIFRPPLLDRGESTRTVEKLAKFVFPSIKVADVAKAMIRQAELVLQSDKEGYEILETSAIKKLYATV